MKIFSKIYLLLFIAIFIWLPALMVNADTIVFKDGGSVDAETYWVEGQTFKYQRYGAVVGVPLEKIQRIEKSDEGADDNIVNFGFDLWKMGTSIEDVMDIAERNDIPIGRSGLVHVNKHFNAKICRPYIQTHSEFEYQQTILGYPAKVSMTFTPESRKLALIIVRFSPSPYNINQKPNDDIVETLAKKYGKPHVISGNLLSRNNLEWRVGEDNTIQLVSYTNSTTITYKNAYWYYQLESEKQRQTDLKKQANFKKDAGKF